MTRYILLQIAMMFCEVLQLLDLLQSICFIFFFFNLFILTSNKGLYKTYHIYFAFIKSDTINKDLSPPLRTKGIRISETRPKQF